MAGKVVNRALGKRVAATREAKGLTQEQLAEAAGMKQSAIGEIEAGRVRRPKKLREIAAALDCDEGFLLGEHPREDAFSVGSVSTEKPYQPRIPGGSPDIDLAVGLGPGGRAAPAVTEKGGVVYSADAVRGEIVLPGYLLAEFTRAGSQFIHWFRTRGDSMEGTIDPGDRVGADTTDTAIAGGGVFVIRDWDGEIQVKRLRKIAADGGRIEIVSDNPKQGNQTVNGDQITILGRVVARISRVG